jgi:hypothetical protein
MRIETEHSRFLPNALTVDGRRGGDRPVAAGGSPRGLTRPQPWFLWWPAQAATGRNAVGRASGRCRPPRRRREMGRRRGWSDDARLGKPGGWSTWNVGQLWNWEMHWLILTDESCIGRHGNQKLLVTNDNASSMLASSNRLFQLIKDYNFTLCLQKSPTKTIYNSCLPRIGTPPFR